MTEINENTDHYVGVVIEQVATVLERMFPFGYKIKVEQGGSKVPWHVTLFPEGTERSKFGDDAGVDMILRPAIVTAWIAEGRPLNEYSAGIVSEFVTRLAGQLLTEGHRTAMLAQCKAAMISGTTSELMGGNVVDLSARRNGPTGPASEEE